MLLLVKTTRAVKIMRMHYEPCSGAWTPNAPVLTTRVMNIIMCMHSAWTSYAPCIEDYKGDVHIYMQSAYRKLTIKRMGTDE